MKTNYQTLMVVLSALFLFGFSYEKAAGLDFDRDKIKRLSKNITTDVKIPETDKKFYLSIKPFYLNNIEYKKSITDVFKKYFGGNYSEYKINSYLFTIDLTNVKYQFLYNQFDIPVYIFSADCGIKIFSPENKLLLSLNIYKRNEKIIDINVKIRDEILFELLNKTFTDFFSALNENSNYLALLSSGNPDEKVKDDTLLLSNRLKPVKELFDRNIKENRLLLAIVDDIKAGADFNLTGPGINLVSFINFGFKIYPVELFSIEHKIDLYSLAIGNLLSNILPGSTTHSFMFFHELAFNSNFNNYMYCTPNFNLFLGHGFQFLTGYNYYIALYDFNDNTRMEFEKTTQTVFINYIRIGAGFFINLTNPYVTKNFYSLGASVFYMATFLDYRSVTSHSLGFDVFLSYNFNTFIYREKPHKVVNRARFRLL